MKFYILRINDELSSDLCKEFEAIAFREGGLELEPNSLDVKKGLSNEYRTGLIHPNCRCHLLPVVLENKPIMDEIDRIEVMGNGTLRGISQKMADELYEKYFKADKPVHVKISEYSRYL